MKNLFSPLSIAPMIDWTNTHFRVFMRFMLPRALLYTEMQTVGAIFNNPQRALQYQAMEQPLALQLGGSCPKSLSRCAVIAEEAGFCEINLNLGCPSERVQSGQFGACLMSEPHIVTECIEAMKSCVAIPVSIKTRIGVDRQDSFEFFSAFIAACTAAGADKIIVHARKAWLKGLNPKQNRTIPPIHYDYVHRLKKLYPTIPVVMNGEINTPEMLDNHASKVDGVMIGRLACQNPYLLTAFHRYYYPDIELPTREALIALYLQYLETQWCEQRSPSMLLKPLYTMFHATPHAKAWKALLMKIQQTKDLNLALHFFEDNAINNLQQGFKYFGRTCNYIT